MTNSKEESEAKSIQREKASELVQSMNIVQDIITIIMALAFTNTVIQFFVNPSLSGTYEGKDLSVFGYTNWWILFLIITTIIRFHHGNMIHLNKIYKVTVLVKNEVHSSPFMESIFLVLEGCIFALMSVYLFNIKYLFWLFVILFSIDFILFFHLICIKFKKLTELIRDKVMPHERVRKSLDGLIYDAETRWTIVNSLTTIILLVLWAVFRNELFVDYNYIFLAVITVNLVLDYGLNRKFYFPTIPKT